MLPERVYIAPSIYIIAQGRILSLRGCRGRKEVRNVRLGEHLTIDARPAPRTRTCASLSLLTAFF